MVNHAWRADRAAYRTPRRRPHIRLRARGSSRRRRSRQRRNIRQRPADTAAYHTERQAITCRVVSRGGVVPYEALLVKYCSLLCSQPHHAIGGRVVPCGSEGRLPVPGAGWIGGRLKEVPKLGSGSKAAMWHFSVSSQEKGFCIVGTGS